LGLGTTSYTGHYFQKWCTPHNGGHQLTRLISLPGTSHDEAALLGRLRRDCTSRRRPTGIAVKVRDKFQYQMPRASALRCNESSASIRLAVPPAYTMCGRCGRPAELQATGRELRGGRSFTEYHPRLREVRDATVITLRSWRPACPAAQEAESASSRTGFTREKVCYGLDAAGCQMISGGVIRIRQGHNPTGDYPCATVMLGLSRGSEILFQLSQGKERRRNNL